MEVNYQFGTDIQQESRDNGHDISYMERVESLDELRRGGKYNQAFINALVEYDKNQNPFFYIKLSQIAKKRYFHGDNGNSEFYKIGLIKKEQDGEIKMEIGPILVENKESENNTPRFLH